MVIASLPMLIHQKMGFESFMYNVCMRGLIQHLYIDKTKSFTLVLKEKSRELLASSRKEEHTLTCVSEPVYRNSHDEQHHLGVRSSSNEEGKAAPRFKDQGNIYTLNQADLHSVHMS
ncbi:hypothetical protein MMC13_001558 [Lambiella insularis]|nr:hypothetical protein [Lambiella insularis]